MKDLILAICVFAGVAANANEDPQILSTRFYCVSSTDNLKFQLDSDALTYIRFNEIEAVNRNPFSENVDARFYKGIGKNQDTVIAIETIMYKGNPGQVTVYTMVGRASQRLSYACKPIN